MAQIIFFFLFFFSFITPLSAYSFKQIPATVEELSKQHIEKRKIDASLFATSLKHFIEDFDPQRIYLLEEEVEQYVNPSPLLLDKLEKSYKNLSFTPYKDLLKVFQDAILRSRKIRGAVELDNKLIDFSKKISGKSTNFATFAKNMSELEERIKKDVFVFIKDEIEKFGEKQVRNDELAVLDGYEDLIRKKENLYLCQTEEGNSYPADKKESCLATYIMKAIAQSLDPHSDFFDPEEADKMKQRLEHKKSSFGVTVTEKQGKFFIKEIDSGIAFNEGGLEKGDELVKIKDKEIKNLKQNEIDALLNSFQEGDIVVRRNGKEETVSFESEEEEREAKGFYLKEGKGIYGLIVLDSFYDGTKGGGTGNESSLDVENILKNLKQKGPLDGLILDLRENGGGFLIQGVKVAGLFITNGVVVVSKYFDDTETVYRDTDSRDLYDGPLIILTSKATASAAEIVTGALQDYGVGMVVGDKRTYGKGTIQNQTVTSGQEGGYFKVTVGRYYTVSGKTPQLDGVQSDIVVPGYYHFEKMGEKFLEGSIEAKGKDKQIGSFYTDSFSDVLPNQKEWFLHYYKNSIQPKTDTFTKFYPLLKQKSEARIKNSSLYQDFLSKKISWEEFKDKTKKMGWISLKNNNLQEPGDPQLEEAVRILQDMNALEKK